MRMGWKRNNSVGKKVYQRNYLEAIFSSIDYFDFDNIYHCHEFTKELKNQMKQKKRCNTCQIIQMHRVQHVSYHN